MINMSLCRRIYMYKLVAIAKHTCFPHKNHEEKYTFSGRVIFFFKSIMVDNYIQTLYCYDDMYIFSNLCWKRVLWLWFQQVEVEIQIICRQCKCYRHICYFCILAMVSWVTIFVLRLCILSEQFKFKHVKSRASYKNSAPDGTTCILKGSDSKITINGFEWDT